MECITLQFNLKLSTFAFLHGKRKICFEEKAVLPYGQEFTDNKKFYFNYTRATQP